MDARRFDQLTRLAVLAPSRRALLRALTAGLLAAPIPTALQPRRVAANDCAPKGETCQNSSECCKPFVCIAHECDDCVHKGDQCKNNADCCSGDCSLAGVCKGDDKVTCQGRGCKKKHKKHKKH